MADYIKDIRHLVGHEPIILNFAGGVLANEQGQILLQQRSDFTGWGLPSGTMEFSESAAAACQ